MKFALRAMAQSLAREFGPQGVHVAHAVIDGVIDIPRTKDWDLGEGGKIDPSAVSALHASVDAFAWKVQKLGACANVLLLVDCRCILAPTHAAEDGFYLGN